MLLWESVRQFYQVLFIDLPLTKLLLICKEGEALLTPKYERTHWTHNNYTLTFLFHLKGFFFSMKKLRLADITFVF